MSIDTNIEYVDSSVNPTMGCPGGCELWNPRTGKGTCYAARMTERYAPGKGWPDNFNTLAYFPERMEKAAKWSDLSGKERPNKPWLNGLPRLIFICDMGDVFSDGATNEWLLEHVFKPTQSDEGKRHVWFLLTKRARRLVEFYNFIRALEIEWPRNLWSGVSVTNMATTKRLEPLLSLPPSVRTWVSFEPLCEHVTGSRIEQIAEAVSAQRFPDWFVCGGESGAGARPMPEAWPLTLESLASVRCIPFFYKQTWDGHKKHHTPPLAGVPVTEMPVFLNGFGDVFQPARGHCARKAAL